MPHRFWTSFWPGLLFALAITAYASAVEGIYKRPVIGRWLVFLHARRIVDITT